MTSYHPSFDGCLKPNLSFPLTEQITPLCRLRIKYYAHGCPHSVVSSIVCDQDVLSVTFSSFPYIFSMGCPSYLGLLMLPGLIGHSTISSLECLSHGFLLSLYNQVMVFYVSRVIFHSGGAWSDSGDVVLTRETRISWVENQTKPTSPEWPNQTRPTSPE